MVTPIDNYQVVGGGLIWTANAVTVVDALVVGGVVGVGAGFVEAFANDWHGLNCVLGGKWTVRSSFFPDDDFRDIAFPLHHTHTTQHNTNMFHFKTENMIHLHR